MQQWHLELFKVIIRFSTLNVVALFRIMATDSQSLFP